MLAGVFNSGTEAGKVPVASTGEFVVAISSNDENEEISNKPTPRKKRKLDEYERYRLFGKIPGIVEEIRWNPCSSNINNVSTFFSAC